MTARTFLISTDDGAAAPGYEALRTFSSRVARVREAPSETVGTSLGTATGSGGELTAAGAVARSLDGSGADVVDLVLVGVNWGPNVGRNLIHSGTFGGCLAASVRGVPSIALSLDDEYGAESHTEMVWERAASLVPRLSDLLLKGAFGTFEGSAAILNVNVPNRRSVRGTVLTVPEGWASPSSSRLSDVAALRRGAVSISTVVGCTPSNNPESIDLQFGRKGVEIFHGP